MPNDEKKNFFEKKFFEKPSWTRGKQLWQICWLFLGTGRTLISPFILWKTWKKKQKTLCQKQSYVLTVILWTRQMQFCQIDRKVFKKTDTFFLNVRKWWEKNIFEKKIFTIKCCNGQTESSFDDTAEKFLSKCLKKKSVKCEWRAKNEPIQKKSLQQISLTGGKQFWQNCRLFSEKKNIDFLVKVRKW